MTAWRTARSRGGADTVDAAFLRAPPFPGARPVSLIDRAVASDLLMRPAADARPADLLTLLRKYRVGGAFWAPPLSRPHLHGHILCPANLDQACHMHAMLSAEESVPWRAIVPPGREGRRIAAWLKARDGMVDHGPVDPWSIADSAFSLWTSSGDERAIVAQLAGIPVRCFAENGSRVVTMLPTDPLEAIERKVLGGRRYLDWFTGAPCTVEAVIEQLGLWRVLIDRNRTIAATAGIASWKRREIDSFLWAERTRPLMFFRNAADAVHGAARADGAIAIWPSRVPASLFADAEAAAVPVYQVEDGFIRSVGLGSGLHPPQSIVVDPIGIYYDPTRPSALEQLLETASFSAAILDRAAALIDVIVATGISKYAAGRDTIADLPTGRRRVLVTGQVEDDRSVLLGGGDVTGNLDLLRRARAAEPDAFLMFKPHPDVEAGHRKGAVDDDACLRFADMIVRDGSMAALLDTVEAVHVWTSLAGFEALLRRREVIVHGQPFFAGWGLTQDLAAPLLRRTRRLSLMELVAGTLLVYPQYLDPVTNLPCTPELLISRMAQPSFQHRNLLTRIRAFQGQVNRWIR
ncbi:MAG: hypothetical protein BVN32_07370 [Proteobacteria bacterium ST_bin14]|nr:MAG: hypothetical protein BVN32_07370 [Proteobacteria bacterium ST_bin14]